MPQSETPTDEHGFPLPTSADGQRQHPPARTSWANSPKVRWTLVLIVVSLVLLIAFGQDLRKFGNRLWANQLAGQASRAYQSDQPAEALEKIDQAIEWAPEEYPFYSFRSQLRLELGDLEGALDDCHLVIEEDPDGWRGYSQRAMIYQQMGQHIQALDDADLTMELAEPLSPIARSQALNQRAYVRALANTELEQALADIEEAIELAGAENSAYLDTRGYVRHLLGQNEALQDLNEAIRLSREQHESLNRMAASSTPPAGLPLRLRISREELAVLHHHRGLIHRALGNREAAEDDLRRGDELGYDPEKGVW